MSCSSIRSQYTPGHRDLILSPADTLSEEECKNVRTTDLQDGYDDPKQPDGTAEDFHNENLNEEAGVLGISQSSPTAHDANADATEEI